MDFSTNNAEVAFYRDPGVLEIVTLPDGKVPVIVTFGEWTDVQGVKFPFAIDEERVSFPPQTFAIYTERVEINPTVDDSVFAMPH